jgi:UDP-2,3-diacylglucosamine pyrophosphatase LpxH
MIVVISDLHFKEERSEQIGSGSEFIGLQHNLPPRMFARFFADIADQAVANQAKKIEIVLAGDIFELLRSGLWLDAPSKSGKAIRPYVNTRAVRPGGAIEAVTLQILDAIAADDNAGASLGVIRKAAEIIHARPHADQIEVSLIYLPGNHDRLANATPGLRDRVRELLGLSKAGGDMPFPHVYHAIKESVLVRHGQEYDPYNFGHDLSKESEIDSQLDLAWYGEASSAIS